MDLASFVILLLRLHSDHSYLQSLTGMKMYIYNFKNKNERLWINMIIVVETRETCLHIDSEVGSEI